MIVDAVLTYQFLKRFVLPFTSWRAYKLGIIDASGNILKKRKDLKTQEERDAFGTFDLLVLNLKRVLAKVPGGALTIGTAAAAVYLMKEEPTEEDVEQLGRLLEDSPTNSVGGGAIAGAGVGPQGEPPAGKGLLFSRYKRVKRTGKMFTRKPDV